MAVSSVTNTTWKDLIERSLRDCGYLGLGMNPLAEDVNDGMATLQWMLGQWERQRWLVFHNKTYSVLATGQTTPYSIGPTGGAGGAPQISIGTFGKSARPNRLESAAFRQNFTATYPIDWPLVPLYAMEDYVERVRIKTLTNFSLWYFYDPAWPTGQLYLWPWPQANVYSILVVAREQLPIGFALTDVVDLPFEYYLAIVSNLALLLRPKYGIKAMPGDELPNIARDARAVLRGGNAAVGLLGMPPALTRRGLYDVFSDTTY